MHLPFARVVALTTALLIVSPADAVMLCAKKSGVIALRDACKRKEAPVDVEQLGVQGPQGDPGPRGETGPRGERGAAGGTAATGPAGGDLAGAYPNPTLRPATEVAVGEQQFVFPEPLDCTVEFDLFCALGTAVYWGHPSPASPTSAGALDALSYFVEPSGFIQFQGGVQLFGGPALATGIELVFVLPPGRRPAGLRLFSVPGMAATPLAQARHAVLSVDADGRVELADAQDAFTRPEIRQWDMSGVRFRVGD